MRTKHTLTFAIAGLMVAGCLSIQAQDRDWDHAHRVIGKTQEDLRRVEHRDIWTVADRGHYEAAERNLSDVRADLDHNRLDRGRLEAAINEIEHITHVDKIDGHARDMLSDDLHELQRLRDGWRW